MSGPAIVFRCDASVGIGTGHAMRCLTLADELHARGATTVFAAPRTTFETVAALGRSAHRLVELPASGNGHAAMRGALPAVDWLVVDHYGLHSEWVAPLRDWTRSILVIDDLADRRYEADLLLDQTLGRAADEYRPLVSPRCRLLLGSRYVLLRPAFRAAREKAPPRRAAQGRALSVLVTMGGTDPANVTGTVLAGLAPVERELDITVVMGASAPHLARVREQAAGMRHPARVLVDVADMAATMAGSDLAIGAGGTTSWERCCVGLPTFLVELADNQSRICVALEQAGAARRLGRADGLRPAAVGAAVGEADDETLAMMSARASSVCDGNGAGRVAEEILQ